MTRETIRQELSLMQAADQGVTKRQVLELAELLGVSLTVLARLLSLNVRTLQRKELEARFDRLVSEQVLQIGAVLERGIEVFGDKERLMRWLNSPVPYLDHRQPIDLLPSRFGAELVLSELERIEQGVF